MKALVYSILVLAFTALSFGVVMLLVFSGLNPCDNCRAFLTPYQGGLIYAQGVGVVVGGIIGITVVWLINHRMTNSPHKRKD